MDVAGTYADVLPRAIPAAIGAAWSGSSLASRLVTDARDRLEDAARSSARAESADAAAHVSFDDWVAARGPALLRFAFLTIGNAGRAEEAVQEALATACGQWGRIVRTDNPDAYVRRMVINADITGWRRFRRRETPVADVFGVVEPAANDPSHAVGEIDAMWALCATLPRRQRAAVVLRYYEGLPDAEIARILGCAEVTVRSQIHRALATLRGRLQEARPDDGR